MVKVFAARCRPAARSWSLLAALLALVAFVPSALVVFSPEQAAGEIRWWLVLLPLWLVAFPLVVPLRPVRVVAAAAMTIWCFLTGFSIGLFFLPCVLTMAAAASSDDRW